MAKRGGSARPGITTLQKHMARNPPQHLQKDYGMPPPRPEGMPRVTPRTHLRPPGSQLTLMQAMSRSNTWEPDHPKTGAHDWYLAELTATGMEPFSMVDEPAFIEFIKFCVLRWLIPGKTYFARTAIPAFQVTIREHLPEPLTISVGKVVHLKTDIWTSCQVNDYMSVTGHWIVQ